MARIALAEPVQRFWILSPNPGAGKAVPDRSAAAGRPPAYPENEPRRPREGSGRKDCPGPAGGPGMTPGGVLKIWEPAAQLHQGPRPP